jgi:predicted PurR-regulated permease PerM
MATKSNVPPKLTPQPPASPPSALPRAATAEPILASPPWSSSTKIIVSVAAVLLTVIVIWRFRSLIQPLILAAVIAYLLNPIVNWWRRRFNMQRSSAVAIVYLGFIVLVLALLVGLGFFTFNQADRLISTLPGQVERAVAWLEENWSRTFVLFGVQIRPEDQFGALTPSDAIGQALAGLEGTLTQGGTFAAQAAAGILSVLSTLFVIMFVAIYLSRDTPAFWSKLADLANVPGYRDDAERLSRDFVRIWDAYLRGQVLLGLAMFVIVSLVLTILGLNYSLALGALAGLLEFLPVIGPLISMAAAVIVAVFQDGNWLGLSTIWYVVLILAVMLGLQQLENVFLVPRFVGQALDMHPVTVIVVVLMGTSLAGILGAVLAAPVAATVKLLGGYTWRKMFDLPPFPDEEPPDAPSPASVITDWLRLRLMGATAETDVPPAASETFAETEPLSPPGRALPVVTEDGARTSHLP